MSSPVRLRRTAVLAVVVRAAPPVPPVPPALVAAGLDDGSEFSAGRNTT